MKCKKCNKKSSVLDAANYVLISYELNGKTVTEKALEILRSAVKKAEGGN